jgi:hypothetical protein
MSRAIQTIFIRTTDTTRSFKFRSQFPKYIDKKLNNSPTLRLQLSVTKQKLKPPVSAMLVLIHTFALPAHFMTTKKERKKYEQRADQDSAGSEAESQRMTQ